MKKRILINIGEQESRVAFLEENDLVELFVEQSDNQNKVGNVYKGVVEGVIPGIQAAFVNIGLEKNAFLHFNDVNMEPLIAEALQEKQLARRRTRRRVSSGSAPDQGFYIRVEDCLKPGKEILVQMTKEAIGTKGARVSASMTLPGKYLVLLPEVEGQGGVSKKIEDNDERKRLKKILAQIETGDASFIIRTAGIGKTARQIYADVDALLDTWDSIQTKFRQTKQPGCIHQEHDLIRRLVRDNFPEDVHEIIVDDAKIAEQIREALGEYNLSGVSDNVRLHRGPGNLFEKSNVEHQIGVALRRHVPLKCGGSLVFDECEALTAIDVNTGSFIGKKDQEKTILQANLEAAEMIARQLRLRDIGGLIVVDFIDMATRESQRKVLTALRDAMLATGDKFSLGRFSEFGCVELTRKRVRQSLRKSLTKECPNCGGAGRLRVESQIWRDVKYALLSQIAKHKGGTYEIVLHPQMSDYITEQLGDLLWKWEKEHGVRLDVRVQKSYHFETFKIARDGKVLVETAMDKADSFEDVDYLPPSFTDDERPATAGRGERQMARVQPSDDEGAEEMSRGAVVPTQRFQVDSEENEDSPAEATRAAAGTPARPEGAEDGEGDAGLSRRRRRRRGRGRGRQDEGTASVGGVSNANGGGDFEDDDEAPSHAPIAAMDDDAEDAVFAASQADADAEGDEHGEAFATDEPLTSRRQRRPRRQRDGREGAPVVAAKPVERSAPRTGSKPQPPAASASRREERIAPAPAAPTRAPQPAVVAEPEVPFEPRNMRVDPAKLQPGLYGYVGTPSKTKKKTKKRRFDANQTPESHYGWTAVGPAPGVATASKKPRAAAVVLAEVQGLGAEPSLLTRSFPVSVAAPAPEPREDKKKTTEPIAEVAAENAVEAVATEAPVAKPRGGRRAAAKPVAVAEVKKAPVAAARGRKAKEVVEAKPEPKAKKPAARRKPAAK